MRRPGGELASQISRALIAATNQTAPTQAWTPSLEQTLHRLGCRRALSPSLVARVIDPFLLNHHSLALGFFNWASQQPGFSHTPSTYQSVLKALSASRQLDNVEKLLKQVRALNIHLEPSIYRSLITSLISGKRTHVAFSIFTQEHSLISSIGSDTCNSLLATLSSAGNLRGAQQVLEEMLHRGIRLSTLGFGVFIWRFCTQAELRQTLNVLDEVRKTDFSGINGSLIAVLVVLGLCSESRTAEAICTLDALRERDCKPDFLAYRIVAEGLREKGSVVDVEKVLKKKRKLGVAPRSNDYKDFIFALISDRLISEAKELAQFILSGNFPIEDNVLDVLIGTVSTIDACCAMSFLKFMLSKERFPTLVTLINLNRNLCKHDKINELVEVFHLLSARDYFRDTRSYNVIITFLCLSGRVKEAYQVLQEMKKKGLRPDVSSYNALLEACCREDLMRPAKRLWDEMFTNGCNGNTRTYDIFIRKFVELGQIEEAQRLFCQMLDKGVGADETIYRSLLGGLCPAKDLDTA